MVTKDVSYTLSTEATHLQRSVMRELLRLTAAPDIISLAGGLPATNLLPVEAYRNSLNKVLDRDGGQALQYRPQFNPLKEWIAGYMKLRGVDCTPEQIFITNGNQQGLTILSRLFLDPGAPAAIEELTFTGIQQVTSGRDAKVYGIPVDLQTGVEVDALEDIFRKKRPRLAVIIPDFHNPLGVSITPEKRAQIAELAGRYAIPVVEDDPYSPLRFSGDLPKPIKAYDEDGYVFYLGSFSKMLAPGLRLGWVVTPLDLLPRVTTLRESIDLETSALTQRAVYQFLSDGLLEPHLKQLNAENHLRCNAMMDALEEHFADLATWTHPQGGLFVWMTLPDNFDTWDLFHKALDQEKVAFVPGGAFSVSGGHRNTIRLNFSSVTPDMIREGIARLAKVVKS